jgi:hypothetical protein
MAALSPNTPLPYAGIEKRDHRPGDDPVAEMVVEIAARGLVGSREGSESPRELFDSDERIRSPGAAGEPFPCAISYDTLGVEGERRET